jgi:two-component system, NtrC family, nitrogen regulation sensor histidine kinase NtrY
VTFRTKLLFISSFMVAGAVALVTGAVSISTRRAFDAIDRERRQALLTQFRDELTLRGSEVARRVELAASSRGVQQIAAGAAEYDHAQTEAASAGLDFLDVVEPDLTIISSGHWPARFGYKNDWQIAPDDWHSSDVFLARIPTPDGGVMALTAVRPVAGGKALVAGGRRLSPELLKSLGVAPGMRALLWLPRGEVGGEVIGADGAVADPEKLASLIQDVRTSNGEATGAVQWTSDRSSSEAFLALPITRAGTLTGVLLAGTSLSTQLGLERSILRTGLVVGASGIVIGVLLGWWTTERITRPVGRLAAGARAVAGGDLSARVEVLSRDEIGELANAFNRMTEQLLEQRDRAIQAERVAAWRELARRLAHELKNPLFPLQITIENLQRSRESAEFDEVFRESTTTLLAELGNLKTIIGRFSDFAKMPAPQFETVDINEIVRGVMKLNFQVERPNVKPVLELAGEGTRIQADPDQLRRAIGNLVLNALDAMPEGGTLLVRTALHDVGVRLEVSDSGQGLTEEECQRLFTPYYTTKQHGTGLGLAIVQSVVSDHHGKISVFSASGLGTTFTIDLPASQPDPLAPTGETA